MRALAQCDVRADEDQVAASALDHFRQHRGGQPVRADEVDLDLGLEGVGADLVEPAEERVAGAGDQQLDLAELIGGPVHKALDRSASVTSSGSATASPPSARICVDELLALVDTARTERDRETAAGQFDGGGGADPR